MVDRYDFEWLNESEILGFSISENFASLRTLREITLNHEDEWIGDVVVCCQRCLRVKNASRKGRKDAKEEEIHGGLIYS